jgi:predicted PurR-regulated permease PerM
MPTLPRASADLTRLLLGVLFLSALVATTFWIRRPFLVPALWASMLVVTTWPALLWLQRRLWRRRSLAALVMVVGLLLLFVLPVSLGAGAVIVNADDIAAQFKALLSWKLPAIPDWLAQLPFVGPRIALAWQQAAALGLEGLMARLSPYAGSATRWFVARAGGAGLLLAQFGVTLVIAAILYVHGETAARGLRRFAQRIAGERGVNAVDLAGAAVRGVALGVGVTAVVQSLLGGIGLAAAGVPFAGLLTAVMFVLCLAQIGPSPVLLPAVIWIYWSGHSGWGTFLLVWSLVVVTLDNVLRPMLIQRGADLPLLLVFGGVIGGLLAFGLVGVFVGPVVLAVAYTLLAAWMNDAPGE